MPPLFYPTIALSAQVSSNIDLRQYPRITAIGVPGVTSGGLSVQGAFDSTSGSFAPLINVAQPGSGDLIFNTGPGSRMIMGPITDAPPYLRLALSVPQAAVRTFTILATRW